MRAIVGLFARSPFRPLLEHTERVHQTVELLPELFDAFTNANWEAVEESYQRISKLEHKADVVKNDIRDHLPSSIFLPVDRGDVLLFLKEQDSIADRVEDVAVLLTMRHTPTPDGLRDDLAAFVDQVVRTSELWYETARELPTLQEAGFAGPEVERTMESVRAISDYEWEADKLQAKVTRLVLDREDELGAVSVMFWMRILITLGDVANRAENTADRLRLMLARR
ncbi:MAG TPA: TIGR00153 family protein [Longimicrobiales bacterium]|nr:TIGR00153 family protein [Longimicrobiales bacterium]